MIKKKIISITQSTHTQELVAAAAAEQYQLIELVQHKDLLANASWHTDSACLVLEVYTKMYDLIIDCKNTFSLFHVPMLALINSTSESAAVVTAGADDYQALPTTPTELKARIAATIQRAAQALTHDPLTGMASTQTIIKHIMQRLGAPLALLYIDIDYFKAYNDAYGFARGDALIGFAASVLREAVFTHGNQTDFIGRIGGDDFVIVTTPNKAEALAQNICSPFDSGVTQFYNPDARLKKKITVINRQGLMQDFPLASLSIGIVSNEKRRLLSIGQIAQIAAELKQYAKTKPGGVVTSNYVKDRRTQ